MFRVLILTLESVASPVLVGDAPPPSSTACSAWETRVDDPGRVAPGWEPFAAFAILASGDTEAKLFTFPRGSESRFGSRIMIASRRCRDAELAVIAKEQAAADLRRETVRKLVTPAERPELTDARAKAALGEFPGGDIELATLAAQGLRAHIGKRVNAELPDGSHVQGKLWGLDGLTVVLVVDGGKQKPINLLDVRRVTLER